MTVTYAIHTPKLVKLITVHVALHVQLPTHVMVIGNNLISTTCTCTYMLQLIDIV